MERYGEHKPVAVWWEMLRHWDPCMQHCSKVGRESPATFTKQKVKLTLGAVYDAAWYFIQKTPGCGLLSKDLSSLKPLAKNFSIRWLEEAQCYRWEDWSRLLQ